MAIGYPVRSSRAAIAPVFENARKITNPRHDLDADDFNHILFQIAGMNVLNPLAWVAISWSGAVVEVDARAEAWNPDGNTGSPFDLDLPTRSGAGIYQIDYNAQYPDADLDLQTIDVQRPMGWGYAPTSVNHLVHVRTARVDANSISARVYEWEVGVSTDWALADVPFVVAWY